jgi:hypothetical protein
MKTIMAAARPSAEIRLPTASRRAEHLLADLVLVAQLGRDQRRDLEALLGDLAGWGGR